MVAVTTIGVLALVVAGCSGGSPGGGDSSFVQRLRFVPASVSEPDDGETTVQVVMADLERAADLAGLDRPDDTDDPEAVGREYLNPLTGYAGPDEAPRPVAVLLPEASSYDRAAFAQDEFEAEVGWSLVDVSWFAEYQVQPGLFTVMGGDFDQDRLDQALGEREDDIWRVGGDDHGHDMRDQSVARPIGEALRLALDSGRLMVGRSTPPVEDSLNGGGDTLADDPVLRAMAEAMDDAGVYSVVLQAGGPFDLVAGLGIEATPERLAEEETAVLPEPFLGVGAGLAYEDETPRAVFTYAHPDEATAEANGEALQQVLEEGHSLQSGEPWSSWFTVEDIRVERTTVVAELGIRPETAPMQVYRIVYARDGLVIHR